VELKNCGAGAFLLNAGAKSSGAGVICPGAGAKRPGGGMPRLAHEVTEAAAAVPRNDCAAKSIGRGRQSVSAITLSLRYARSVFRGEWMTMQRWLIAAAVTCVAVTGCSKADREATTSTRRPQQAGQGTNPLTTAGHLAGVEVAGLSGDQRAMQAHINAMHKNLMRDMHLADASRRIDPEAARAAVRPLQGVQSAVWIDNANLLVLVGGSQYRSMAAIDNICLALEPLGDTMSVVVNVQDVMASTSEGADTLSRNCQLGAGERAMFQQKRRVDVLDPEVRKVFRAQQDGG
jgi:hypothetical protein